MMKQQTVVVYALLSQSLFYWKLLCNLIAIDEIIDNFDVTILILLETPLQYDEG